MCAAVAAEHWLVADAVAAALRSRGIEPRILRWPRTGPPAARRSAESPTYDVGLVVSDLDSWPRLRATERLLRAVPTRWAVLTGAPVGARWGAAYEYGAAAVLPSTASLDDVVGVLLLLSRGYDVTPREERDARRHDWALALGERAALRARVQSLTERERQVLGLLYDGETIAQISSLFGVSPATVRSQVKAILHKLEVNSQLGAVAAYRAALEADVANGEGQQVRS